MTSLNSDQAHVKTEAFKMLHLVLISKCEKDPEINKALWQNAQMLTEWIDEYAQSCEETEEFLEMQWDVRTELEKLTNSSVK